MKQSTRVGLLAVPALALALAGATAVSARGMGMFGGGDVSPEDIATHQRQMFEQQAELLGTTVGTVTDGWAQGKNIEELAADLGIDADTLRQKMVAQHAAQMKQHLQVLVDQGVITQAQATQRLAAMQDKKAGGMGMHRGFGGKRHGGMGSMMMDF